MIKTWVLKAVVQKTISFLPFKSSINFFFQKYITKGVYLSDEYFYDRLDHAKTHLHTYKKFSDNAVPSSTLEIGTGWYPVVPVSFFLSGTDRIYSVDLSFLTSKERIKTTLLKFVECEEKGLLKSYLDYMPARFSELKSLIKEYEQLDLKDILERLHIHYIVGDARKLNFEDDSIDFVNSNNTFEHIYPSILIPILAEFKRVVKKETGVMSHAIDMSDHFAHFDKSINIYNFLRFSEKQWAWIDNSIQPQSRLRFKDYKEIYKNLGIPVSEESFRKGNQEELKMIPLADLYLKNTAEENAISHCHLASKM